MLHLPIPKFRTPCYSKHAEKFINKVKGEILMKKRLQILAAILTLSMTALPVSAQTSDSESVNSTDTYSVGTVGLKDYKITYEDVQPDDWFYLYVKNVTMAGTMTGLNATTFAPNTPLVRAQFAQVLYRLSGEPDVTYNAAFQDVADNDWYTSAVIWANSQKITTGYTDTGLFGTNDNITREQLAVMLLRYDDTLVNNYYKTDKRADLTKFQDGTSVSDFAKDAMAWAVERKLIEGKDNGTRLDPQGTASRAECAAILTRYKGAIHTAD